MANQMDSNLLYPLDVRQMKADDLAAVAQVHSQTFPDYFLTHMGQTFLQKFYQQFNEQGSHAYVAVRNDQIVGFVAGTSDLAGLLRRFYRANIGTVILITLQRFFLDAFIRREIFKRLVHIPIALRAILARKDSSADPEHSSQDGGQDQFAELMSIGVHPDFQGQGIAEALVNALRRQFAQDGVDEIRLTVRANNGRARRFYEKTGWRVYQADAESIQYFCSTHQATL